MQSRNNFIKPSFFRWGLRLGTCTTIMVAAILGLFIAMLAGGYTTVQTVNDMKSDMKEMKRGMQELSAGPKLIARKLEGKFSDDQIEITTKYVLGIVENVYNISNNLDIESIGKIANQFDTFMNTFSLQEMENVKIHMTSIITGVDSIVSSIPADKIANFITTMGKIDMVKINNLVDSFSKLHEIKINI